MSLFPQYIHIVNPKLKYIYLSFDDEDNLVIKSPRVTQQTIEQLLLKKASWIEKSKKLLQKKKGKKIDFSSNMELFYKGKAYPIVLQPYEKKRTKLHFNEKQFILSYTVYNESVFQRHINNFYKKEVQTYLPSMVSAWAEKMSLYPTDIRFRKTKRQWGSCSSKNILSFNTMIMKLPENVIEYVIVHELAHIVHKHHQQKFWNLVESYLPDFKLHIRELKNYTT